MIIKSAFILHIIMFQVISYILGIPNIDNNREERQSQVSCYQY